MSKSVSRLTNLLLSSNGSDIALLLLRIFVGIMMLTHGVAKIENFSALKANFPDPVGLGAGFSLLLITCAEVGCSLLVIVGLVTRLAGERYAGVVRHAQPRSGDGQHPAAAWPAYIQPCSANDTA